MKIPRSSSRSVADAFLADLAARLPSGFWGSHVVVAVSGGADSVALFTGLHELASARAWPMRMVVAHAWHDLREEAAGDAEFVERLATERQVPCAVARLQVLVPDGIRGEGIEARARRLRHRFFTEVARETGARYVVLAHTADDQAETILHRGLRGTGVAGLAGMAFSRSLADGIAVLRPLLGSPRAIVRHYLAARGQPWREDASNADLRFARNFLRHEILTRCAAGPYPAAVQALVRLGGQAAVAAGALRSAAEHLLELYARREADGEVTLRTARLAGLDEHLLAEIFVALWQREGWPQRDMTSRHYGLLARLAAASAAGSTPDALLLPGRVSARAAARQLLRVGPE